MRAPAPDITLIVACYEEEEALPRLFSEVERLLERAAERRLEIEVVLVDDGSRDRGPDLMARWCAGGEGRRVVTHGMNRGFGAAMRTGFTAAGGGTVICYDADATYPVEDVLRLHDALEGVDVAGASPFAVGGRVKAPPLRRLLSGLAARLYRLALRDRAGETTVFTCAFRAYRAESLEGLSFESDGFLAAAEVLARLKLSRARVREIPSTLSRRREGRSKMRIARTGLGHLRLLARIALRRGGFHTGGGSSASGPGAAPVVPEPTAGLPAWNAALNRKWPMERIEAHPVAAVRLAERRRRAGVLRLLAPRAGDLVLSVGAGRGPHTASLLGAGARPVSLDIDVSVLRVRERREAPAVAADAQALPFRSAAFDGVTLAEVLEHCPRPGRAISEALRVLVPGGRAVLSVPDDEAVLLAKRALAGCGLSRLLHGLPEGRAPGHLHVFGRASLRALLEGVGRLLSFTRDFPSLAFLAAVGPKGGAA